MSNAESLYAMAMMVVTAIMGSFARSHTPESIQTARILVIQMIVFALLFIGTHIRWEW